MSEIAEIDAMPTGVPGRRYRVAVYDVANEGRPPCYVAYTRYFTGRAVAVLDVLAEDGRRAKQAAIRHVKERQ
jgi:hypothetical protein